MVLSTSLPYSPSASRAFSFYPALSYIILHLSELLHSALTSFILSLFFSIFFLRTTFVSVSSPRYVFHLCFMFSPYLFLSHTYILPFPPQYLHLSLPPLHLPQPPPTLHFSPASSTFSPFPSTHVLFSDHLHPIPFPIFPVHLTPPLPVLSSLPLPTSYLSSLTPSHSLPSLPYPYPLFTFVSLRFSTPCPFFLLPFVPTHSLHSFPYSHPHPTLSS